MTSFQDGPAKYQVLLLRRSSDLLRVVCKLNALTKVRGSLVRKDVWDALDTPGDQPDIAEKVYAYRLVKEEEGGGGFFRIAEYKVIEPQPSEEMMRSQRAWDAWVGQQQRTICNDCSGETGYYDRANGERWLSDPGDGTPFTKCSSCGGLGKVTRTGATPVTEWILEQKERE